MIDLALKDRMPSASTARAFAEIGGLMAFGADDPTTVRDGAKFVDRILKGRHPNVMPIEQPTKFELIINMKTAKALGITVPATSSEAHPPKRVLSDKALLQSRIEAPKQRCIESARNSKD